MKHKNLFRWLFAALILTISATATQSYSQTRTTRARELSDSTLYPDGTYRLPNGEIRKKRSTRRTRLPEGTVIYRDGTVRESGDIGSTRRNNRTRRLPDNTIVYPDGTIRYPDGTIRRPGDERYDTVHYPEGDRKNGRGLPPGHAKKRYGSKSARHYAPAQMKKDGSVYRHQDDHDWKDEPKNKDRKSKGRRNKKKS